MAFSKFGSYDSLDQIPWPSVRCVNVGSVFGQYGIFCQTHLAADAQTKNNFWFDGDLDVFNVVDTLRSKGWNGEIFFYRGKGEGLMIAATGL